jgi:DNA-binding response OmpR family regulator
MIGKGMIVADPIRTILLVEDDDDARDAVAHSLASCGYRMLSARDGRHALELLGGERDAPSLIVLDWMMPVMSGHELLGHLAVDERWASVPVLVVSAVDRVVNAPVAAVLTKPVRMRTLVDVVDRLCGVAHRGDAFRTSAAPPRAHSGRETAPTRIIRRG